MILGTIDKDPVETYEIGIDFADRLLTGETVASTPAPTVTSKNRLTGADSSATLLSGSPFITGTPATQVKQRIRAGAAGERHLLTFTITTTLGNVYSDHAVVVVRGGA
jgi:hypothetical protein